MLTATVEAAAADERVLERLWRSNVRYILREHDVPLSTALWQAVRVVASRGRLDLLEVLGGAASDNHGGQVAEAGAER